MGNNSHRRDSVTTSTPTGSATHDSTLRDSAVVLSSTNGSVSHARDDRSYALQAPFFVSEDMINDRLLRLLHNMNRTLNETRYGQGEREDRVQLIMCRELLTFGYKDVKDKMDRGEIPLGDLHYGSASTFVQVGPVTEFVAPRLDVERMWCWNQKAVDIIDRWPTFDDYYDVWNGVLGRNADTWEKTIIVREYSSSDHGYKHKYCAYPVTSILTLDRDQLEKFWNKASERVEALRRIDELKQRIRDDIIRHNGRMREEDWNHSTGNRNVRRRLVY